MRRAFALIAVLLLAACGHADQPAAPPDRDEMAGVAAPVHPAPPADAPVILAFGDSLYAGYQLDPGQGYPPQLEAAMNAHGVPVRVVNAGVSGDTTAAGLQRLAFTLDNQPKKPALVMVGLGGNDMLRALPPAETRANMEKILAAIAARHIPVLLTAIQAAPNLGADYARAFNPIWPDLAREHHAPLVPLFVAPLIGHPELMLADHIHPNPRGVAAIVQATEPTVTAALKDATMSQPRSQPR